MNKDTLKNLGLVLLLGVTVFSMASYVSELKARFSLQGALTQVQNEARALAQEKQNLLQELGKEQALNAQLEAKHIKLKAYVGASKNRMARLFRTNLETQDELEEVSAKFGVLKAENRALIDSYKCSYLENKQFRLKLSSVAELKKVIRELRAQQSKTLDLEILGNGGFLIRGGRTTSQKIKIEVSSAQTASPVFSGANVN